MFPRFAIVSLTIGLFATTAPPAPAGDIPILYESAKLLASDPQPDDWFGQSVAIHGDTLAVGATQSNCIPCLDSGKVHVFERGEDGTWVEVARLAASEYFGVSVSLYQETLVVGAANDDDRGEDAGAAFVYERSEQGSWDETDKLLASDGASEDSFGGSVSISGDIVVVGAEHRDDLGESSGAAYVFERDPQGGWNETKLLASDGEELDVFGDHVAISGTTIVVGAKGHDDPVDGAGAAYVFERAEEGAWEETAKLVASDAQEDDYFGVHVAIDGDLLAVGAQGVDGRKSHEGATYVFERGPLGEWVETAKLLSPDPSAFDTGFFHVAVSGGTVVVGAPGGRWAPGYVPGTTDVFRRRDSGAWVDVARLFASDGGWQFGVSTAIDGDTVVVGARRNDEAGEQAGAAYVFTLEGCTLEIRLDAPAVHAGDDLRIALLLEHRRQKTVTVPFRLWIEDEAGAVIAATTSPPQTLEPGDVVRSTLTIRLPEHTPPGPYRVLVGIDEMRQGIAGAVQSFRVVE